jgi:hypothetical protein
LAGLLILPFLAAVPFAFVAVRHRDRHWYRPVWWLYLAGTAACSFGLAWMRTRAAASTDPAESLVLAPLVLTLQLPVVLYFIFLVRCYPRRPVEKIDVASIAPRAAA